MGSLGWPLHLFTRDFLESWNFEAKTELPTTNSENGYLGIQEKEWSWSLEERLPCCRWTFYNYEGSLTTPPLLESVIWTVFKEHITMSEEQVKAMRCMKITCEDEDSDSDGGDMVDNYRPPCPVGGRVVRVSS